MLATAVDGLGGHLHITTTLPYPYAFRERTLTIHQRLGGPQNCFKRNGEEKVLLAMPGSEPQFFTCLPCSLVSLPTEI
jgi:hypothetical protein